MYSREGFWDTGLVKVGYIRTSTKDQNPELQRRDLLAFGYERIFEKQISSRKADRPELRAALEYVRPGHAALGRRELPAVRPKGQSGAEEPAVPFGLQLHRPPRTEQSLLPVKKGARPCPLPSRGGAREAQGQRAGGDAEDGELYRDRPHEAA
jgi:hypothetical protein